MKHKYRRGMAAEACREVHRRMALSRTAKEDLDDSAHSNLSLIFARTSPFYPMVEAFMQGLVNETKSKPLPEGFQSVIASGKNREPVSWRNVYRKAVSGKSKAAGLKAFCLECVGWQRNEITACTDEGCPLWPYRPYRNGSRAPEDVP